MEQNQDLLNLSSSINIEITSFLDPKSILNFCLTCKKLQKLLQNEGLWFEQQKNFVDLGIIQSIDESKSKQEQFLLIIQKFKDIKRGLENLLQLREIKSPKSQLLNNYYNTSRMRTLREYITTELGGRVPIDYYITYRLLNGQQEIKFDTQSEEGSIEDETEFGDDVGFLGGYSYYNFQIEFTFRPLTAVKMENNPFKDSVAIFSHLVGSKAIKQYIDVSNVLKLGEGTIFSISGKRVNGKGEVILELFIFKQSLQQYFSSLQNVQYSDRSEIVEIFDTIRFPKTDVTTNGIRVRTDFIFSVFDKRFNGQNLYTYQIRISANGAQGKWRLQTRHWEIFDGLNTEKVDGPGVIGYYPIIFEGCDDFVYESCSHQPQFNGTMGGYLTFKNTETNEEAKVVVGTMNFEFPRGSALVELNMQTQETDVLQNRLND